MSQLVRQSNLFAAEDWKVIYRSFKDADFKSYDFETNKDLFKTLWKKGDSEDSLINWYDLLIK